MIHEFPYQEAYGPAYNYEVGYLEGLKEAHRLVLTQQSVQGRPFRVVLADFLKGRIEEQKKAVFQEIPDDVKDIHGWNNEEEMPDE